MACARTRGDQIPLALYSRGDERFACTRFPASPRSRRGFRAGCVRWVLWRYGARRRSTLASRSHSARGGRELARADLRRGAYSTTSSGLLPAAARGAWSGPAQSRWGKSELSRCKRYVGTNQALFDETAGGGTGASRWSLHRNRRAAGRDGSRAGRSRSARRGGMARAVVPTHSRSQEKTCRSAVHPRVRFGGDGSPARTSTPASP